MTMSRSIADRFGVLLPLLAAAILAWPGTASAQAENDPVELPGLAAELGELEAQLQALAERCRAATVGIVVPGGSMGSGVVIDESGLILTAAHVLPGPGEPVVIVLADGRQVPGESLGLNSKIDSGMARIAEPGQYTAAPIAEPDTVWEGDWLVAFGHGGGVQTDRPAPMRLGKALHISSDTSEIRWITTDCTVISGDSGGPLFDLEGRVVGIHSNIGMSVLVNRHVPVWAYHAQWDALQQPAEVTDLPPVAEPIMPGLASLPDSIERQIARRLAGGDNELRNKLEAKRDANGRIDLDPEFTAELFGRDDLLEELRIWQDKLTQRRKRTDQIENADAGGLTDEPESAVSQQSRKTRQLIIEKKRERMLGDIAQDLRQTHGKIAEHVLAQFEPAAQAAGPVTAKVLCRGEVVALATIVRSDGYLVTKASQLVGPPRVQLGSHTYPARVVNGNGPYDLVLLKIDAQDLPVVQWAEQTPAIGTILVSPGPTGKPLSLSILGVSTRPIPERVSNVNIPGPAKPYLGVAQLKPSENPAGIRVGSVVEDGPADRAGLQPGDLITAINSEPITQLKDIAAFMKEVKVDQAAKLSIIRGEQTLELNLTLGKRPQRDRSNQDDRRSAAQVYSARGGELSNRRTGFPAALTHDAIIWAKDVGGPVVDREGRAVGLNIARYGRTATYALPAEQAKDTIQSMLQGQ